MPKKQPAGKSTAAKSAASTTGATGKATKKATGAAKAVGPKPADTKAKAKAADPKTAKPSTAKSVAAAASSGAKAVKKAATRVTKKVAEVVSAAASPKKTTTKPSVSASKAPAKALSAAGASSTASKAASKKTKTAAPVAKPATRGRAKTISGLPSALATAVIRNEDDITPTSPTDTREHFFQEHRGTAPLNDQRDLPREYGDTKICMLVRDPEWIYAYWEVNDATREQINLPRNGHSRRIVLRVYQISDRNWPTENANYFFDVDVSPYAQNWYVRLPETCKDWCGELGMFDDDGKYISICRSNIVRTPPDTVSDVVDAEWMSVEESFEKIYSASGGHQLGSNSDFRGSETILRHLEKQITGMLRGNGMSSSSLTSGGGIATRSVAADKQFWLQVHTELILYGATEPDARVTIQGKVVKLNRDGSFTMRFALPDGEQVLDVTATSRDGEMKRSITPIVTKITKT